MKERCRYLKHKSYKYYGERGITVCERWLESFWNFLEDMGPKPLGQTLDRIDNDLSYYKDNCRWSTSVEQNSNKRSNVKITHEGDTRTAQQWARCLGMDVSVIYKRLKRGWTPQQVLKPPRKYKARS